MLTNIVLVNTIQLCILYTIGEPLFYRNKLVNPNIIDTITVTELENNNVHTLLCTDISTDELLKLFKTVGIDQKFINFVEKHRLQVYNDENEIEI